MRIDGVKPKASKAIGRGPKLRAAAERANAGSELLRKIAGDAPNAKIAQLQLKIDAQQLRARDVWRR